LTRGAPAAADPAAIVYRATWPDQQVIHTTIGELAGAAAAAGISSTALIVVGPCLTPSQNVSRLYAPEFSTGFRPAASPTGESR
jgi:precorrin-4/cobalt-precorrin-4 C11-methyltransferase